MPVTAFFYPGPIRERVLVWTTTFILSIYKYNLPNRLPNSVGSSRDWKDLETIS